MLTYQETKIKEKNRKTMMKAEKFSINILLNKNTFVITSLYV